MGFACDGIVVPLALGALGSWRSWSCLSCSMGGEVEVEEQPPGQVRPRDLVSVPLWAGPGQQAQLCTRGTLRRPVGSAGELPRSLGKPMTRVMLCVFH